MVQGSRRKDEISGVTNSWTYPIKARIDMLSTGIPTAVGIKIMGADLEKIQQLGEHIEMLLKDVSAQKAFLLNVQQRVLPRLYA